MTRVFVQCEWCGRVETKAHDVLVNLETGSYSFTCPMCQSRHTRPMSERVERILLALIAPTEPGPITEDEIQRFVAALNTEDIQ